jgi:hypothetical protein
LRWSALLDVMPRPQSNSLSVVSEIQRRLLTFSKFGCLALISVLTQGASYFRCDSSRRLWCNTDRSRPTSGRSGPAYTSAAHGNLRSAGSISPLSKRTWGLAPGTGPSGACTSRWRQPSKPSWCGCTRGAIFDVVLDLRLGSSILRQMVRHRVCVQIRAECCTFLSIVRTDITLTANRTTGAEISFRWLEMFRRS